MGRIRNYNIGHRAEERIKAKILEVLSNATVKKGPFNGCPDLSMSLHGHEFGIECKVLKALTLLQRGWIGITADQIHQYNLLPLEGVLPLLIVEVRVGHGRSPLYRVIPWHLVNEKYNDRNPGELALTFWWVMDNSKPLHWWLEELGRTEA